MRTWVCRLACLRIGRLHSRFPGIRLYQKRYPSLHLLCIGVEPVLVPVRLSPVALSKVLLRVVVPRGRVIGILIPPRLVIGGNAVGITKCVHFIKRLHPSPFLKVCLKNLPPISITKFVNVKRLNPSSFVDRLARKFTSRFRWECPLPPLPPGFCVSVSATFFWV